MIISFSYRFTLDLEVGRLFEAADGEELKSAATTSRLTPIYKQTARDKKAAVDTCSPALFD